MMTVNDACPTSSVATYYRVHLHLNNAHRTQNDRLAQLQRCYKAKFLELQQGSYIGSLRGTEAGASMARESLTEVHKANGTFDLHGFCLLVQHISFSNFLSGTVPLIHEISVVIIMCNTLMESLVPAGTCM